MKPSFSFAVYTGSLVICFVLVFIDFYFGTASLLSGPRNDDAYVYSWKFQAAAFGLSNGPAWLAFMGLTLVAESFYLHFRLGGFDKVSEPR